MMGAERQIKWREDSVYDRYQSVLTSSVIFAMGDSGVDYMSPLHRQPGLEIHLARKGIATFYCNGQAYPHNENWAILFHADLPHRVIARGYFERNVILFSPEALRGHLGHNTMVLDTLTNHLPLSLLIPRDMHETVAEICRRLCEEYVENREAGLLMRYALLVQLLILLYRVQIRSKGLENVTSFPALWETDRAAAIEWYIQNNITEPISLQSAAALFKVTPSHLARIFHLFKRMTFTKYVNTARVCRAEQMLKETTFSITDIAFHCGFSSLSYFSRVFTRNTGKSPSEYRTALNSIPRDG